MAEQEIDAGEIRKLLASPVISDELFRELLNRLQMIEQANK